MRRRASRILPTLVGVTAFAVVSLQPALAHGQTPYVPYFGKNHIHYDTFDWHIYKTDHFEIYYYPELEKHLERIASYAESAYQHHSAALKHDLADKVPLILFKTQREFEEQNIAGELPPGVLGFTEPERNRMVIPVDQPPDQLYALIAHELTHVFEFDIIPRGLISSGIPLWMDEGLADFMAGAWIPLDLMQVRDAAITDSVPKMSQLESQPLAGREPYSLGHAAFEFIEAKWGMEGLRQFLFSLRKNVIGGGESAYEEALKLKPEDFDEQFDRYLKERFKPFRDKQRPADYGRDLAPNREKTPFVVVESIEASPTGDMIAAVAGNRHDEKLDIILVSARDGQVIRNLTKGFDKDRGFEYIAPSGGLRGNLVPWIAWSPVGDRIAYFVKTEKDESLIIENVVTDKIEHRLDLKAVDAPESPAFSPDGKRVAFAAGQNAISDIFAVTIDTGEITNLTKDEFADYSPTFSPDGQSIVYTARVSGSDKLFRLDLATGQKTQITFGTHNDTGARFYDDHTVVFTSTATDPNVPIPAEVARNGDIPNIWTLDLKSGELRQWTDTATGNVSPAVLREGGVLKVAFVTYYKAQNGIHAIEGTKPIAVVQSSDFGAPGPIIDFQPPISHTLLRDNIHKKGAFEKMSLAGRPPVSLGVTSGGNFYGNTVLTFTDVLGDKQMTFLAQSIAQFRTTAFTYTNIERRLQYGVQVFSNDQFYYGQYAGALYDPALAPYVDRSLAQAQSSQRGASGIAFYPFNRYSRVEMSGGYLHLSESFTSSALQDLANQYQLATFGSAIFRNGSMVPLGVAFVQETTVFRDFGPVAGGTMRLAYNAAPRFGNFLSKQTFDGDARHYTRLGANGLLALRLRGFKSIGPNPDFLYFGGNSEMHGYQYLEFLGQKAFFADAELRFPIIEAMLTPFGVLGGLRGVFFFNAGAAGFNGLPYSFATSKSVSYTPTTGYTQDALGNLTPVLGPPVTISGLRLVDGRASYGLGLESFLLGFPMHFDFSWKTLFNKSWEDALFAAGGGSAAFRKMKFSFWIGYDF
jgi:hypothetical protein